MIGYKAYGGRALGIAVGITVLAIIFLAGGASADSNPNDWIQNTANGHYYKLTAPWNWSQAEAQAVTWEGDLVTINDREEELWLKNQFGENEYFWIGFNDIRTEGNWEWVSGEPVTYTNWEQGEPNNNGDGRPENGAVMNWGCEIRNEQGGCTYGDGWNDLPAEGSLRGIVESVTPIADSAYAGLGLRKDFIVQVDNDTLSSGLYYRNFVYSIFLNNIDDSSDTILSGFRFSARADNITNVFSQQYATWNKTSVDWVFPAEQVIQENDGWGTSFEVNYSGSKYLNVNMGRWINQTEFTSTGYQLAMFNVSFENTDFMWVNGNIWPGVGWGVNASIVPGTFITDAPVRNVVERENNVMIEFDKQRIETGVTYNFSLIIRVEPPNEMTTVIYKPPFEIDMGYSHTNIPGGIGFTAEIPSYMLPEHVNYISASTNILNSWQDIWVNDYEIFGRLNSVVRTTPILSVPNGPVHNINKGTNYTTIQAAINDANLGDEIHVDSGTYFENVNVNKQVTLRGFGMPVVDAGGSGSAITLAADGIRLEGFRATGSGNNWGDAGIRVTSNNGTLIGNNASSNPKSGIYLDYSSNNTLSSNNAYLNNDNGISLIFSNNNNLSGNNVYSNDYNGIFMSSSSNNTLSSNNAYSNNDRGIALSSSSNNNTLSSNNAYSNNGDGIYLVNSNSNNLLGNIANFNIRNGISLEHANENKLASNIANSNINNLSEWHPYSGIFLTLSTGNKLTGNIMSDNKHNFLLYGEFDSDFANDIDMSNTVDGKPIYYIKNATDNIYDESTNAGTFYCINCVNVTLKNLDLKKNGNGIFFWNTTRSKIQNVNASNNNQGIWLDSFSNYNTLMGNNVKSNHNDGICLLDSSNNILSGNKASSNNNQGIDLISSRNYNLQIGKIYIFRTHRFTALNSSSNNMLIDNNANSNNNIGILLIDSSNNTLIGTNASSNNNTGIVLDYSDSNTLNGNNASSNNNIGIVVYHSSNNTIYNNIFNNSNNVIVIDSNINTWNTTRQSIPNIIGGSYLGGNFWANPGSTGFSQTCADSNSDGICDSIYPVDYSNNFDFLPLALQSDVSNVAPVVKINLSYYVNVPMELSIAGQGKIGNSVELQIIQNGTVVASKKIIRTTNCSIKGKDEKDDKKSKKSGEKGDDSQDNEYQCKVSANLVATIDLSKPYNGKLIFDTTEAISGGTPVWIKADGDKEKITTFNTQKGKPASYHQEYIFELDDLFTLKNKEITFSGKATDPGTDDLTFNWNFGDGGTLSKFYAWNGSHEVTDTVKHAYSNPGSGNKTVTLNVTDENGAIGSDTITINLKSDDEHDGSDDTKDKGDK